MERLRECAAVRSCERGQTMAEYAAVLAVITLAIVTSISLLSQTSQSLIERVAGYL
jgi:Flp pilus assembly pilin Flp